MRRLAPALAAFALSLIIAPAAGAATYTWTGGNGNWAEPLHWISSPSAPGTVPDGDDDVVINAAGTYTVTINSLAFEGAGRSAKTLTLGGPSGTQELVIKTDDKTAYASSLRIYAASAIGPNGVLTLHQDARTPNGANAPQLMLDGPLTNQGKVLSRLDGTAGNQPDISGASPLVNNGTLKVESGRLTTKSIVNAGTIQTDAGGFLFATSTGTPDSGITMNGGAIVNTGRLSAYNGNWRQNGGALSGNPVNIDGGSLVDAGGTGTLLATHGVTISGTIPSGQTVLLGERGVEQTNGLAIPAAGLTIAAGGALIAQGPPANGVGIDGPGLLTVSGTLQVNMPRAAGAGTNDRLYLRGSMTVSPSGLVDLTAGSRLVLLSTPNPRTTWSNNGTIALSPGSNLQLDLSTDDRLMNNGTIRFGIAGPSSFGRINGTNGVLALGGTAEPQLVGGYAPAIGTAFKVLENKPAPGAFGSVLGGFSYALASDGNSASLVYGGAPTPAPNPGSGGVSPDRTAPALSAVKVSSSSVKATTSEAGKITVKITRSVTGRKVKGKCVALKASNRSKKRCTRTVVVATRSKVLSAAGTATIALPKLAKGTYTVTVTSTDAAGNVSAAKKTTLKVKKKRK